MAKHICDNCGAAVADEEFCPTCGAWIDQLTNPPAPNDDFEEFSLDEPQAPSGPVAIPHSEVQCPSCGSTNPASNRHCEECGARLAQGSLPVAPRPAVQATAGVRAVIVISAILFGVVIIALLFNLFGGDDAATTTTTTASASSTTSVAPSPTRQQVLSIDCDPAGLGGSFSCDNLINESQGMWQLNWVELSPGETVKITLNFTEPIVIRGIEWVNLPEGTQFQRNYRAKTLLVSDDSSPIPFPITLDDVSGSQTQQYGTLRSLKLEIEITDAYDAQIVDGTVFTELAVQAINVLGYPAPPLSTTPSTTEGG